MIKLIRPLDGGLDSLTEGQELLIFRYNSNYTGYGHFTGSVDYRFLNESVNRERLEELGGRRHFIYPYIQLVNYTEFPFRIGFYDHTDNSGIIDWLRNQEHNEEKRLWVSNNIGIWQIKEKD